MDDRDDSSDFIMEDRDKVHSKKKKSKSFFILVIIALVATLIFLFDYLNLTISFGGKGGIGGGATNSIGTEKFKGKTEEKAKPNAFYFQKNEIYHLGKKATMDDLQNHFQQAKANKKKVELHFMKSTYNDFKQKILRQAKQIGVYVDERDAEKIPGIN